jgi:hypothetical protein
VTDKLTLYNLALGHLGERRLASLAEPREPRRVLDDYWDSVVGYCLERKLWNFMLRVISIDASSTVTPAFGYVYAFKIPADRIRTVLVSTQPQLNPPLNDYKEETGYWYANATPLFVGYSSNDPLYGMDLGAWTSSFEKYVGLALAVASCTRIRNSDELLRGPDGLLKREMREYKVAAANSAMNNPVGFAPTSSWVRSRRSWGGAGGDNPSGSLLG